METRGAVVSTGFPLDMGNGRIGAIVIQCSIHELVDSTGVECSKVSIGDKTSASGERHQSDGTYELHSDSTGRFGICA